MTLIRIITLQGLINNVRIFARHIPTTDNGISDALSRLEMDRFRKLGPHMNDQPDAILEILWLIEKYWMFD